ncbi:MAG: histidine triad nucleotide-binding protein [Hydrogenoanaerobacterium sp.]
MVDCLFCKIAAGEIPSKKIYEDDELLAFYDIDPKAPVHFLVIPKEHIASADELTPKNSTVVAHAFVLIARLAKELGLKNGYRIVNNCGEDAGQSVPHLHFHILGGRGLAWPPG